MKYTRQREKRSSMPTVYVCVYEWQRAKESNANVYEHKHTVRLNGGTKEDGRVNLLVLIDSK